MIVWAHTLALQNNLKTIAIPGSGISKEVIYPASNKLLAEKILDANGMVLSEFLPNAKSQKYFFPQRNRIMAGLSDLVLVVEAKEKSGTLITARLALEYNKDLAVIPNSIFSKFCEGSNNLLKQGAHPIFCGNDILELLGVDTHQKNNSKKEIKKQDCTELQWNILKNLDEPKNREETFWNFESKNFWYQYGVIYFRNKRNSGRKTWKVLEKIKKGEKIFCDIIK